MSERDYMAEFNEASSRSRDILIEAGGHINYLRSLLRDLLPFLPKNHPWLPGINEQIEALPVDERDATIAALQAEVERYKSLINTPHTDDFIAAVRIEAAHQQERWGTDNDGGKTDADWFWLVGYLAGKALSKPEKQLHHIITTAAACLNWHAHKTGAATQMRPGIEPPSGETSAPLEILLCVHGIPIDSPSACPSCHAAASAQITNRVIGFAVFTDDIATAALYPLDQTPNAFDAAKRWHASITAITVARGSPEPPLSAEWCKHCGCGNDTRKYAHLPGCPAHLCEYVSCKITVPHDHSVGGPASAQEQKK